MKKQPNFLTEYITPDYTLPLSKTQIKRIENTAKDYTNKLNDNNRKDTDFYRQKLEELKELDKSIDEITNMKKKYLNLKGDVELEKQYAEKLKRNLQEETKKYEKLQKASWREKFLQEKNGKNAIFATPTFTTYNLKNIQGMFPTPNNMTVHERIDLVNNTPLTDDDMKLIKNFTGKNIGSKNIYDYINVPNQNIKHPLEDLITQRYPKLNPIEKMAMEKYIKDLKRYK